MNRNERLIMRKALDVAIAAGWNITFLDDSDSETRIKDNNIEQVILLGCNLDECLVYVRKGRTNGWIRFIFSNGNDGLDVISDYTVNLTFMDGVNEYCKCLEDCFSGSDGYVASNFQRRTQEDVIAYHAGELRDALAALVQRYTPESVAQAERLLSLTSAPDMDKLKFYPGCDDRKVAA